MSRPPVAFLLLSVLTLGLFLHSCAGFGGSQSTYGGLGESADPIPFMSAVRTGKLPNGLTYYILKNSKPENRASLALAVHAGSIMEQDDEQGLAHFVEHMSFNGTARFPEAELRNYLRSLGMRFGADLNAYTYYDETVYRLDTPVETSEGGIKRIPARALAILDDWTHAVTFAPQDVEDERAIILEEYRAYLGAGERVSRRMLPVLLHDSIYAERLPIGLPEIIETVPAERLLNFYRTWYRPDNMAVIIVGDFDDAALEAELASQFTAPAPATPPTARPDTELPPPVKNSIRVEIITDPEFPYTRIDAYYKTRPGERGTNLAYYREQVMRDIVNRIISRRFENASSDPATPYADAGTWETRYGRTGRFYVMAAISKPELSRESLRALLREKESILRYGFTASEIDLAKRALLSELRRRASEQDRQESRSYLEQFQEHFLRGSAVPGSEWELQAVEMLLPGILVRDLAATARSFFETGDLTLTIIAPEAEAASVPDEAELRRIIAEAPRSRIPRPLESALGEELLTSEPEPGAVLARTEDAGSGAEILTLSNGVTVILKATANRNNEIMLYAMSRGGFAAVPAEEAVSAALASELAQASGLGPYTHRELTERITGRQVSFSFWSSAFQRGFEGSATRDDLKTLFELLYLGFTQPRIDRDALLVVADQYRTQLLRRDEEPEGYFFDQLERAITGNNPWLRPMTLEDVDRINLEQALRYLRRAADPADYTFVFTGNIDAELMEPYLETYLASIPGGEIRWHDYSDPGLVRPGKSEHPVRRGQEEKSIVYMGWFKPENYSQEEAAAAQVLSGYLEIVLTEEIRERQGGVYSISAGADLSPLPPPGELTLQTYFLCSPNRAQELSEAVIRELENVAQGRINREDFARAVETLQKGWEQNMQSNRYLARNYASLYVTLNLPPGNLHSLPTRYAAVRPQDIQNLCRTLLPLGPARIVLYPGAEN